MTESQRNELLRPYNKNIAQVSPKLAEQVFDRSGGICEICNNNRASEIHHICGRRRKAHLNNLLHLCIDCHKPPNGIHANQRLYNSRMASYQLWCEMQGFDEEETRYLLGTKSNKLFY